MTSTWLQFRLNAQPVVNGKREVFFSELLLRVFKNYKKQNTVDFIQQREQDGSIINLDMFHLNYICDYLNKCKLDGIDSEIYSLNLSGLTVSSRANEILRLSENVVDKLIIEITETSPAKINQASQLSKVYQEYGGIIALDDFIFNDYSLNLLNHTLPRIVKFDVPQTPDEIESFILMVNKVLQAVPHAMLVFERVKSQKDIDFINSNIISCGNFFQSYYTGKDQPCFITK